MTDPRNLSVFLCHASQDKPIVRELYQRLIAENWIDPWLDEEKLLPGQDWDMEIENVVEAADVVIVCLSSHSVTKEGYVQKEIRKVLDIALEKPEGTIFIIPLRLDDCELPRRLRSWHYVDFFPAEQQERAYQRLLKSLNVRRGQSQQGIDRKEEVRPNVIGGSYVPRDEKKDSTQNMVSGKTDLPPSMASGQVDIGGSILLIVYFVVAALDKLTPSSDIVESLLAIAAVLAGIALLGRRQIPPSRIFKLALIVYLLLYGFGYRLSDQFPVTLVIAGLGAVVSAAILAVTIRLPRKPAFYSSISFAAFLFLVGIYEIVTNFDYSLFTTTVETLIFLTSIVTSVLCWMDL